MGLWRFLIPGLAGGVIIALWRKSHGADGKPPVAPPSAVAPPRQGVIVPSSSKVYATAPDDAVPKHGFVSWEGMMITPLPLIDAATGLFARLSYREALGVAERYGAKLLTPEQVDLLFAKSPFKLAPCILPPTHMMASREWAEKHDACVRSQLEKLGWDGRTPVANANKHWTRGAPPGRAHNYGWHDIKAPNGRIWQSLGTRHDDGHRDYSQLTYLVKGS